jgi:hypothetical protein
MPSTKLALSLQSIVQLGSKDLSEERRAFALSSFISSVFLMEEATTACRGLLTVES